MEQHDLHIESGTVRGNAHTRFWALNYGSGQRRSSFVVRFLKSFDAPPDVFVVLSSIDMVNTASTDFRIAVKPDNITAHGFEVVFSTWLDSLVNEAVAVWIAIDKVKSKQPNSTILTGHSVFHRRDEGYTLSKGYGDRIASRNIEFEVEFGQEPNVLVGIAMIDHLRNGADIRIDSFSSNIEKDKCKVNLKTWSNSCIWSAGLSWIAIDKNLEHDSLKLFSGKSNHFPNFVNNYNRVSHKNIPLDYEYALRPKVLTFLSGFELKTFAYNNPDGSVSILPTLIDRSRFQLETSSRCCAVPYINISFLSFTPSPNEYIEEEEEEEEELDFEEYNIGWGHNHNRINQNQNQVNQNIIIEANNAPQQDNQEVEEGGKLECKICFANNINTVLIPCGHIVACFDCAMKIVGTTKECPICKTQIQNVVKTYLV